jgi:hypothetical protein
MSDDYASELDTLPLYNADLPKIPVWDGVGNSEPIDITPFTSYIESAFPSPSQIAAVRAALEGIADPERVDISMRMLEANRVMMQDATAAIPADFSTRGGPVPTGALAAMSVMVRDTHASERAFERINDIMDDESTEIRIIITKAKAYTAKLSAYLNAKYTALSAINDYLDAYLAELMAQYAIAEKQAELETGLIGLKIEDVAAKASFDAMLQDRLAAYFAAYQGHEDSLANFWTSLLKHNDYHRDITVSAISDAANAVISDASAGSDAIARRAAASASALGSVISSAVTSFG